MPTLSSNGFKILSQLRQTALAIEDDAGRKMSMNFLDCYKAALTALENSEVKDIDASNYLIRVTADFIAFTAIAASPIVAAGASDPKILAGITTMIGQQVAVNIEKFYTVVPKPAPNEKVH